MPGFDLFETGPGTEFNGFDFEGVPVVIFDFGGTIGEKATARADTIVQRIRTASVATSTVPGALTAPGIPIELRALNIKSTGVIDLGFGPHEYYVTLQSQRGLHPSDPPIVTATAAASSGEMVVTFDSPIGGTFESMFNVRVDLRRNSPTGIIDVSTDLLLTADAVPWGRVNPPDIVRIPGVNRRLNTVDTSDDFFSGVDENGNAPEGPRPSCDTDPCPDPTMTCTNTPTGPICSVPPCNSNSDCPAEEFCNTTTAQCQARCFPHDEANAIHCTGRPFCDTGAPGCGTACDGFDQDCDGTLNDCDEDACDPFVTAPASQVYECIAANMPNTSVAANGTASAVDDCAGARIGSIFNQDVLIDECGITYEIDRLWYATDICGNGGLAGNLDFQSIEVVDTTDPVFTHRPQNMTLECTIPQVSTTVADTDGPATATDACNDLSVSHADIVVPQCGTTYDTHRTWAAEDVCFNEDHFTQDIYIVDTTNPVITCPAHLNAAQAPDSHIECTHSPLNDTTPSATGYASSTDTCDPTMSPFVQGDDGSPDISFADVVTPQCGITYMIDRTWNSEDECLNAVDCPQNIDIDDTTNPVVNFSVQNGTNAQGHALALTAGYRLVSCNAADTCDADLGTPHNGDSSFTMILGGVSIAGDPTNGYQENIRIRNDNSPGCQLQAQGGAISGGQIRMWKGKDCIITCQATDDCGNKTVYSVNLSDGIPPTGR